MNRSGRKIYGFPMRLLTAGLAVVVLIVGQIAAVHNGSVTFDHGKQGGFAVTLSFPIP